MASAKESGFDQIQGSGYTIDYSSKIGSGGFGLVYKGTNRYGVQIAAKLIQSTSNSKYAEQEAINSLKLPNKHPNIIDVYDVLKDDKWIYIFMEYCEFENLEKFFAKRELSKRQKIGIMEQIARGIEHLHDNRITHRDIKPLNILLQRKSDGLPVVKLSDFGLSKFAEPELSTMSSDSGTVKYKAPEFWDFTSGKLRYKKSVDIFAAGLTFLAMLQSDTSKKLSVHIEERGDLDVDEMAEPIGQTMYNRKKMKIKFPDIIRKDENDLPRMLIRGMISPEPDSRPTAGAVLSELCKILELSEVL